MKTYFLKEKQTGTIPFAIHYESKPTKYQKIHHHDCCEIMFIHSGFGWCSINGNHCTLFPGDLIFMGESDTHEFLLEQNGAYYNVRFKHNIISSEDLAALRLLPFYQSFGTKEFTFPGKCIFPLHERDLLESLFQKMLRETAEDGPCLALLQKSHLYELLVIVGRYSTFFRKSEPTDAEFSIGKISNWMLTHYQEKITLEILAKRFRYSPEYLGRFFLRHAGISFTRYLAYIRVEQAIKLLESSNLSISEIAYRAGFFDQSHFTKTFRKITGMLPGEFRKNLSLPH